jgi:hypothetical protein
VRLIGETDRQAETVRFSKAILLILVLVTAATAVGVTVCETAGLPMHTINAAIAAGIGLVAAIVGLLPLRFRADTTPVALFQSAWIGSIIHMAIAAALGIAALYLLKLATPFVVWLLMMYWITLMGLCVVFVKTLRSGELGPTQPITSQSRAVLGPEIPTA